MKTQIRKIKKLMMQSLEELKPEMIDGKKRMVATGDFICHEDIPDECPKGFDDYFCVVGEDTKRSYLVLIQEIEL